MPSRRRIKGRLVWTDDPSPSKPERTRLIGYSLEQSLQMNIQADDAGLDVGDLVDMRSLWKLYDIGQIERKLDVICPGHGFTSRGPKIPMLIKWIQNEDLVKNQAF